MLIGSILLVICSGLVHAIWNMFAKSSEEKSVFLWAMLVPPSIVLLPFFLMEMLRTEHTSEGIGLVLLSLSLQCGYALLLSQTYKYGDLSQVYPIMRGTSTLLIPAVGIFVLGERFSIGGWIGLASVVTGLFMMSSRRGSGHSSGWQLKPVALALSVGLCTTMYVLVDKVNLHNYSPLFLLEIGNIGFVLGLTPTVLAKPKPLLKQLLTRQWKPVAIGSVLNPGSYFLFLLAMGLSPVSHISPVREVGIVFGTVLGIVVLKEAQGARRIVSSTVVALGIIVVALFGSR